MTIYEPKTLLGFLALLLVVVAFVGGQALTAWISHRKQNQRLGAIEEQVVNNHGNDPDKNLRTQIDRVEAAVGRVADDIGSLRKEMLQERKERAQDDDDLSARVTRLERRLHPEPFG